MSEVDQIKARYQKRKETGVADYQSQFLPFVHFSRAEREYVGTKWVRDIFGSQIQDKQVLEIGAGMGDNVHFLMRAGFDWQNIYLNELLEDRIESLKNWFSENRIFAGDIQECDFPVPFDLIFQSTVFSSILDRSVQVQIVKKLTAHLKPGGYFLWYDFCFDNPKNKDVKGISKTEVQELLQDSFELVNSKKVTLAPPLGRRVGRAYGFFNCLLPFLRTHQIMLFKKKGD